MSWVDDLLARFPARGRLESAFLGELARILAEPFGAAAAQAEAAVRGEAEPAGSIEFVMDPRAAAWARARAAELIAEIDETTRDLIRARVVQALAEGTPTRDLGETILDAVEGMAGYRADRIARTETALAMNQGTLAGYREGGIRFVEVLDGPGCLPDGHDDAAPLPDPNVYGLQPGAQANGQIWPVETAVAHPLGHPNCVRAFAAVISPPPGEES